jgi:hypothetical protein
MDDCLDILVLTVNDTVLSMPSDDPSFRNGTSVLQLNVKRENTRKYYELLSRNSAHVRVDHNMELLLRECAQTQVSMLVLMMLAVGCVV